LSFLNKIMLLILLSFSSVSIGFSQQKNLPLNWQLNQQFRKYLSESKKNQSVEKQLIERDAINIHNSMKPQIESNVSKTGALENVFSDTTKYYYAFTQKLYKDNLIIIKDQEDSLHLTIDPLMNFEVGNDFLDTTGRNLYNNTRGLLIQGDIGSKFSFSSSFYENQSILPQYLDAHARESGEYYPNQNGTYNQQNAVIPGQGRTKPFNTVGFDYASASGYISYSPSDQVNVQFGTGKHFIGNGYRSMLLSDNSFAYPYLRVTTATSNKKGRRLEYTNLYAFLSSLYRLPVHSTPEATYAKKAGTFHYLSYKINHWLQLGLFEGVIWEKSDSTGSKEFNPNFINPIIFVNTLIHGFNGINNAITGMNLNAKILNWGYIYGQLAIDDIKHKRYAYQLGVEFFDFFKLKNVNVLIEYNHSEPYAYSHQTPLQNYSHFNQPLAHPVGSGFDELIGGVSYQWGRFQLNSMINYISYNEDFDMYNLGQDVFQSTLNPTLAEEINRTKINIHRFEVVYLLNKKTNGKFLVGYTNRAEINDSYKKNTAYLFVGLRTSLKNIYYDF